MLLTDNEIFKAKQQGIDTWPCSAGPVPDSSQAPAAGPTGGEDASSAEAAALQAAGAPAQGAPAQSADAALAAAAIAGAVALQDFGEPSHQSSSLVSRAALRI